MNFWNRLQLPGKIYFGLTVLQTVLVAIFLVMVFAGIMSFKLSTKMTVAALIMIMVMLLIQLVLAYFIAMFIDFMYGKSKVLGWAALVVLLIFGFGVPVYVVA